MDLLPDIPEHRSKKPLIYDNLQIARGYDDARFFTIKPRQLSVLGLMGVGLIGLALAIGACVGLRSLDSTGWLGEVVLVFIICTDIAVCASIAARYRYEKRRGPWFIYDKQASTVSLPRQNAQFPIEEVVRCEGASNHLRAGGSSHEYMLYLVIQKNNQMERWRVLQGEGSVRCLNPITRLLTQNTPIQVVMGNLPKTIVGRR